MKTIVISAVNLIEGGTLSILKDCLASIEYLTGEYRIIILVHDKNLLKNISKDIQLIEMPKAKKSWFNRIYHEYYIFNKISKNLDVYLWFSMHDMTPRVKAKRRAVYCHNSSPFYRVGLKEIFSDYKFTLFTFLYKYLYLINIKKNDYVVVQQDWIREQFSVMFNLKKTKIIVAKPEMDFSLNLSANLISKKGYYIYPAFPRTFKNFEYICEAIKILNREDIKVLLTISGDENSYSKKIYEKYKDVTGIEFIGLQSREKIFEYYSEVEGLIFPSKLETWGLPLSEFATTNKKIFASDLPYAREVLSGYNNVAFFNPNKPVELAKLIVASDNNINFAKTNLKINKPFTKSWRDLFRVLLEDKM